MGLPASMRAGGTFCVGTIFEVFEKTDTFTNKTTGERVRNTHWVIDVKKTMTLRGKEREVGQLVTLTNDQVKVKLHEKFKAMEGELVALPVRVWYDKLLLDGTDALSLAE